MSVIENPPLFERLDVPAADGPVVIAVPHAGREYPASLLDQASVSELQLAQLEDRHADLIVDQARLPNSPILVARRARAWLDLNRDPREIDPLTIVDPLPASVTPTAKSRSGLGLVPRRLGNGASIWRHRFPLTDIRDRISRYHEPYHAALSRMLGDARDRHGVAVLIDCHSMPPLSPANGSSAPEVVIGDRFDSAASPRFSRLLLGLFESEGLGVARNQPYSGGYGVTRHGRPAHGIHAIQIEFDRRLYLDSELRAPGPGLARLQRIFADAVARLTDAALSSPGALAAE